MNNQIMMNNINNQMMMNNSNNQMMMNNNIDNEMIMNNSNNQMMMNNSNNQMMMNNNTNQIGNDKMKELLEELDYMRNKVNLYEKRIKTLEERIKEKDSEIINLKNMLSRNFNYNQNMQQINCNQNPMMNIMAKKNSSKNQIINFIVRDIKIAVQSNANMTIERLIKNFIIKTCIDNFSGDYFFKGNKIDKDSKLTLEQSGISNEDKIYVYEDNDKNQKEKMPKMPSHKHENITIIFNVSTGSKVKETLSYYTKISKAMELFCLKNGIVKNIIGKDIMFIYNEKFLDINDNRTIEEISEGKNSINITVYDLGGVIGA